MQTPLLKKSFPMNTRNLLLSLLLFAAAPVLRALPADPTPRRVVQPDGSTLTVRLCGDEHFHYHLSLDSLPLVQREGFFYYATVGEGNLNATALRARNIAERTPEEISFVKNFNKPAALDALRQTRAALRRAPGKRLGIKAGTIGTQAYPTTGAQRALAILVSFPKTTANGEATDFTVPNPRQTFSDMLNKEGFDYDGATGSVHDYFIDGSGGKFNLTFDVYGPVVLSKDISFYGQSVQGEDLNAWNMAIEACTQLDDEIDFSIYDRDKDGAVDNIYIFYAGQGEATGGPAYTVWQHAAEIEAITGKQYVFDGVRVNRYACSNELRPIVNPATGASEMHLEGIGTVCHEFTHVLGFPDLYDTSGSGYLTPGNWTIMDVGSHNNNAHTPPTYSAYERLSLGWLTPEDIDATPRNIVLENVTTGHALRIPTQQGADEYFLLENRQQTGWDTYLPGHGMLVWHITYDADLWQSNKVNSTPWLQGVDLVEADGSAGDATRPADAFPGTDNVTSLTDDTTPSLRDSEGLPTGVPITEIKEKSGLIELKIAGGKPTLPAVENARADDVTPIGFTARWDAVESATAYAVDVWTRTDRGNRYVDGFHPCTVTATHCAVTGLQAETEYFFTVKAQSASATGSTMEAVSVTTPAATFAYSAPTALEPADVTATGFTARWEAMPEATGYALDVLTRTLSEPESSTVDFTDGLKNLPAGWTTNCKMTLSTAGAYGEAAPSASLSADNMYIESAPYADGIRALSFWYRERNAPCGENYVVIDALCGGSADWQHADTLWLTDTAPSAGSTYTLACAADAPAGSTAVLPDGCTAVRLTYRRVGSGGLAVDDVCVRHGGEPVWHAVPPYDRLRVGSATQYAVSGLSAAEQYYYRVYGTLGDLFSLPSAPIVVPAPQSGIAALCATPTMRPAAPAYDLSGRRTVPNAKGIYIIDGKKVVK